MRRRPSESNEPLRRPRVRPYDVAILGAGFAGALLAWILTSQGRRVVLLDRQRHPRFAIGESSTPLADLILHQLAERYGLPSLAGLASYGRWKQAHPALVCGCKRGFSYFQHRRDQPFHESSGHDRSLLVAASGAHAEADTHWLRRDVDAFFAQQAIAAGARFCPLTEVTEIRSGPPWRLHVRNVAAGGAAAAGTAGQQAAEASRPPAGEPSEPEEPSETIEADFLVGATGRDGALWETLGVRDRSDQLATQTRSTFAHFQGVGSWSEWLVEHGFQDAHIPFDADQAAQHHLLDDGWLWMLRMDDGRCSVGWTRPCTATAKPSPPPASSSSLTTPFGIDRYPSLAALFANARCIDPPQGPVSTGRLQQFRLPMVGARWALLPTAAVTLDPLHSGGIAHGLAGVERLAALLLQNPLGDRLHRGLADYQQDVVAETRLLDRLIASSYHALHDFERFTASTMLYFAAAIRCEEARAAGTVPRRLWSADDPAFADLTRQTLTELRHTLRPGPAATAAWIERLRAALAPWNSAGLLDPAARNRYHYTAATKPAAE